jgi:pimeloyl-ACP methyl ester carboxylesterase
MNAHTAKPHLRLRRVLPTLLAVLAGACGLSAQAAAAASARPAGVKPTVVLVHGAWADGSSWSRVVPELQRQGYTVVVEANPLRGLQSDAAYLTSVLGGIKGPIVLAGHSYGGAVITDAATGNPDVKALVYVDAFVPDEGETTLQLAGARPGSCLGGNPADVFDAVPYPGAAGGDVDLYVKPSLFPGCFANGLPAGQGAALAAGQRPIAASALTEKSTAPAWKTIPAWALVGTNDHVIPPAELLFMAQRAHAHTVKVPAPHLSMLSKPRAVTDLITSAAKSTG